MHWDTSDVGPVIWSHANVRRRKLSEWADPGGESLVGLLTACVEYRCLSDGTTTDVRAVIYPWVTDNIGRTDPLHVLPDPEDLEQVKAWVNMTMAMDGYGRGEV